MAPGLPAAAAMPVAAPGPTPLGAGALGAAAHAPLQQTRHARRLYVGGVPECSEQELAAFFNDIIRRSCDQEFPGGAVMNVYLNRERRFAFVELRSIELTTAAVDLDGITFRGTPLKVKRPNDYNPALVPPPERVVRLQLDQLGLSGAAASGANALAAAGISTRVPDGPGKIFVGGLPYHLTDEQIRELLESFGKLKGLHVVKDPGQTVNKGYCFCEYEDHSLTPVVCQNLHGLNIGDRALSVRKAGETGPGAAPMAGLGGMGAPSASVAAAAAAAAAVISGQPMNMGMMAGVPAVPPNATRVLVLKNTVTREDLVDDEEYQDVVADIREEVKQYGNLLSVTIPRVGERGEGLVLVEYDSVAASLAAMSALQGRKFADRTVETDFLSEQQYAAREF